jgi:hypothetical protein
MDGDHEEFERFEWDAAKSDATFAERGIAFAAAARVFEGDYIEREDTRYAYGERRFVVTGEVDGVVVSVVWTPRGRGRRIISAWPASNRERGEYREQRSAVERADPGV